MMCELEKNIQMDALKAAYSSLPYAGISIKKTLIMQIKHWKDLYEESGDKKYLEEALLRIKVYVQFGFDYKDYRSIFMSILDILDLTEKDLFMGIPGFKKSKLTKTDVKGMLGSWKVSDQNLMTVTQTVEDIISKVKNKDVGIHIYKYTRGQIKYYYELVITEEYCYLRDKRNRKNYVFED